MEYNEMWEEACGREEEFRPLSLLLLVLYYLLGLVNPYLQGQSATALILCNSTNTRRDQQNISSIRRGFHPLFYSVSSRLSSQRGAIEDTPHAVIANGFVVLFSALSLLELLFRCA